jgi:uncharacterized protein YaaQ
MKLIITIIRDIDNESVSQALISQGFRVTRIASTGGFFRRGSSTLMIGTDNDKVDQAIEIVKKNLSPLIEPGVGRGTLFVIDVEHYHHF